MIINCNFSSKRILVGFLFASLLSVSSVQADDPYRTDPTLTAICELLLSSTISTDRTCKLPQCTHDAGTCKSPAGIEILYFNNFNHNTSGQYVVEEWREDWHEPPWNNNITYNHLADILPVTGNGRALQINYPENMGTSGGVKWRTSLEGSYDDLYLSYQVRFPVNWDGSADGGKLPGLCGGSCPSGGICEGGPCISPTEGFSVRLMFSSHDGKSLRFYNYYNNKYEHLGSYCPEPYTAYNCRYGASLPWNIETEQGKLHTITMHIVMNTPGEANGIFEGFFDSKRVARRDGVVFRDSEHSFSADTIMFETFFGGGTGPVKDEQLVIDNVVVYRYTIEKGEAESEETPFPACQE